MNQSVRSIGSVGNGRRSAGLFAGRAERQHGVALGVLEESASDRRTSAGGIANWRPHVEGACIPALLPLPLQNNADLAVEDRSGWTPLHFAARTGARNVVQVCPHLRAAGNICARTWPQICADSSKAAPGLTCVGAGTRPYLRRDWPASAQRLTHICTGTGHVCAGTGPHLHLRRDWPAFASAPGPAPHLCSNCPACVAHSWGCVHNRTAYASTAAHAHAGRQVAFRELRRYVSVFLQMLLDSRADPNAGIDGNGPTVVQASPPAHVPCVVNQVLLTAQP